MLDTEQTQGPCDICKLRTQRMGEIGGYRLAGRPSCSHLFVDGPVTDSEHPELYEDAYFNNGGAGYVDYLSQAPQLIRRGKRYASIAAGYVGRAGNCFDVGAAAGFTLEGFRQRGWEVSGVEINRTMARYACDSLGISVKTGSFRSAATTDNLDCITMLQVLEHLDNPVAVVEQLHAMLVERGIVIVETWNIRSLPALVLRDAWHQWSPPTVRHWYTPASLTRLFVRNGFSFVQSGRPYKAVSVANGMSLVRAKLGLTNRLRFLDAFEHSIARKLAIPYPPLDVFWAVFRKR